MDVILVFIGIIFGVLQIVLFFKVWKMTDNVKRLTEHFTGSAGCSYIGDKVRLAKMQGQTQEEIQLFLVKSMANDIIEVCDSHSQTVEGTVSVWQSVFNKAGVEMPDYLKQIKTAKDVEALYK